MKNPGILSLTYNKFICFNRILFAYTIRRPNGRDRVRDEVEPEDDYDTERRPLSKPRSKPGLASAADRRKLGFCSKKKPPLPTPTTKIMVAFVYFNSYRE